MPYRDAKQARDALQELALTQGGYFTATQAQTAGYGKGHLAYHVRAGNVERVAWGLYRLPGLPHSEHDDLIRWSLWSRDRSGAPQAIVGHESALAVHGLGDGMPADVHLVVPSGFRKVAPDGVRLHRASLEPREIEEHEGFEVTTPLRAIVDLAARADSSTSVLRAAVREAGESGLVRLKELRRLADRQGLGKRLGLHR